MWQSCLAADGASHGCCCCCELLIGEKYRLWHSAHLRLLGANARGRQTAGWRTLGNERVEWKSEDRRWSDGPSTRTRSAFHRQSRLGPTYARSEAQNAMGMGSIDEDFTAEKEFWAEKGQTVCFVAVALKRLFPP